MGSRELDAIASCQDGDLAKFDVLYSAYIDRIFGFIYRRTLTRQTAEDLTSTVFLKAIEKIGSYNMKKASFSTWLFTIARNTITDHYRTHRETKDIDSVWDLAADDDQFKSADTSVDIAKIREALESLDSLKREIVMLKVWEGLSYQEIADIVGKSEGNCKVIFCRTIDGLRKEFGPATLALILLFPILK